MGNPPINNNKSSHRQAKNNKQQYLEKFILMSKCEVLRWPVLFRLSVFVLITCWQICSVSDTLAVIYLPGLLYFSSNVIFLLPLHGN